MIEQKLTDTTGKEFDFAGIDNGSYTVIKHVSNQNQKDKIPKSFNSCVGCKNAMWFLEYDKNSFAVINSYCRIMNTIKFNSLTLSNIESCAGQNS